MQSPLSTSHHGPCPAKPLRPVPSSPSFAWLPSYLFYFFFLTLPGSAQQTGAGQGVTQPAAPHRHVVLSHRWNLTAPPLPPPRSTAPTLHYHRISSAQIIPVRRSPRTPNSSTLACIDPDKPAVHGAGLWPSRTPGAVWHQVSLNNFSINKITGFALAGSATRILLLCTARAAQYPCLWGWPIRWGPPNTIPRTYLELAASIHGVEQSQGGSDSGPGTQNPAFTFPVQAHGSSPGSAGCPAAHRAQPCAPTVGEPPSPPCLPGMGAAAGHPPAPGAVPYLGMSQQRPGRRSLGARPRQERIARCRGAA